MWKVSSTIHSSLLALHVSSGVTGLLIAPLALAAPKLRGWHTRLGYVYLVAVSGVCTSAVGLAALHWSRLWWLAAIGVATEAAALAGLAVRLRRPASWRQLHVSFMCGSYVSLVTALLVVNFGGPFAWLLPTVVGTPVIAWAARRAATPLPPAPASLRAAP